MNKSELKMWKLVKREIKRILRSCGSNVTVMLVGKVRKNFEARGEKVSESLLRMVVWNLVDREK